MGTSVFCIQPVQTCFDGGKKKKNFPPEIASTTEISHVGTRSDKNAAPRIADLIAPVQTPCRSVIPAPLAGDAVSPACWHKAAKYLTQLDLGAGLCLKIAFHRHAPSSVLGVVSVNSSVF